MKFLGVVLAVCGVGVAMGQAPVGGKRAMTFADLMAMKRVSDPQVSASGKWVLFSVTEVSLEKNTKVNHLWVVRLGGGGRATAGPSTAAGAKNAPASAQDENGSGERQVTFGSGESFGRFSPDGKWVSYSMGGQIYLAGWDEGAGKVGSGKKLTDVAGGADGAVWAPDSKRLMFVGEVWPECSVKGGERAVVGKADSSASLRNDKQGGLRNDKQENGGGRAVVDPTLRDGAAKDGALGDLVGGGMRATANTEIPGYARNDGGTRLVGAEAASWGEEDACDRARDEGVAKSAVKGQVWEGLLYRHWDQYTGEKRSHVLVVNLDGGGSSKGNNGVRDLTPAGVVGDAEVPTFSLGGPLGYAWAPDSHEIAYVANLDSVPAASTNNDVFTLRLDEVGAKAVKVSTSLGSDDGPAYSPDGKWLAWRSQARAGFESDKFDLVAMDRSTGKTNNLTSSFYGWVDEFAWAGNYGTILFTSARRGEEDIFSVNTYNADVGDYATGAEFNSIVYVAPPKTAPNVVTFDSGSIIATRMRINQPAEIVQVEMGDAAPMYAPNVPDFDKLSAQFTASASRVLTHQNDDLIAGLHLPELTSFWFTGAEGTRVQGFLLRPPGFDPAKKYPVKFVMHGGPQTALGDSWSYRWNWELMAASGYVVVGINRRGSTGYGQRFIDEVSGDWGGRAYEDLMKGLDYAEVHFPFIDKTRECALGASYGGFMADWVLTHTDRFKCIVTHDGMVDPVGAYGSTEELWFNEWEFRRPEDFPKGWDGFLGVGKKRRTNTEIPGFARNDEQRNGQGQGKLQMQQQGQRQDAGVLSLRQAQGQNDTGGGGKQSDPVRGGAGEGHIATPWRYAGLRAEDDPFRRWSPMRFIERAKTPTLVIHSQKDYRLDVSQGLELFTALQRLEVPSKMLYFPDEGHWVLKPQNSQLWYEEVGDWCDRWTKTGRYAGK